MSWGAIVAIYFLFWVGSAFLLLPFGVRTDEEMGTEKVAGQADSAPYRFDLLRHMRRAAVLGAVMFAVYYANWHYQWLTLNDLDYFN